MNQIFKLLIAEEKWFKAASDGIEQVFKKCEPDILKLMGVLKTSFIPNMYKLTNKYNLFLRIFDMVDTPFNSNLRTLLKENPEIFKHPLRDYSGAVYTVMRQVKNCGLKEEDGELLITISELDDLGFVQAGYKKLYLDQISDYLQQRFTKQLELVMTDNHQRYFGSDLLKWREEKLKYQELTSKLPELQGIFETTKAIESFVDIVIQLNSTDKYGNKTTPEIVEYIAYRLTSHTNALMKRYYNPTKQYIFHTIINRPSLQFKIINVPENIAEDYLLELNSAIENLDCWMDGIEYYATQKIITSAKIDQNSPKVRKMEDKLPELKGIF